MGETPSFVGIDLGTTYSAVAYLNAHGKVEIIPNDRSQPVTPSVVMFPEDKDEEPIVGDRAKRLARFAPDRVVEHVKRHMGDPSWAYKIDGNSYTAEEVSAIILRDLKQTASRHLSRPVTDAVITVPAYFDDGERHATKLAGELAGFNVLGILNEPIAAALAYGLDHSVEKGRILVYDLGGGTFDVTVVDVEGGNIKVIATDGVRLLGGIDWDSKLMDYVAHEFMVQYGTDPREETKSAQRLADEVEAAKRSLSAHQRAKLFLECGEVAGQVPITRQKFEDLTEGLLLQTEAYTETVLEKAEMTWDQVDRILLAGGSTRMPMVRAMLRELSGKEPDTSLNPDECVAIGACYYAAKLRDKGEVSLKGVSELDAVINKVAQDIVVENVASHSIGILTVIDGLRQNLVMIREQTPLPAEVTRYFATHSDHQVTVEIKVLQGDSDDPDDCSLLGLAIIRGLPAGRPRGSKVSVTYLYSEEGILTVRAEDVETGQACEATIDRDVITPDSEEFQSMRGKIESLYALEGETGSGLTPQPSVDLEPVERAPAERIGSSYEVPAGLGQLAHEMSSIAGHEEAGAPADAMAATPPPVDSVEDPWEIAADQGLLSGDIGAEEGDDLEGGHDGGRVEYDSAGYPIDDYESGDYDAQYRTDYQTDYQTDEPQDEDDLEPEGDGGEVEDEAPQDPESVYANDAFAEEGEVDPNASSAFDPEPYGAIHPVSDPDYLNRALPPEAPTETRNPDESSAAFADGYIEDDQADGYGAS